MMCKCKVGCRIIKNATAIKTEKSLPGKAFLGRVTSGLERDHGLENHCKGFQEKFSSRERFPGQRNLYLVQVIPDCKDCKDWLGTCQSLQQNDHSANLGNSSQNHKNVKLFPVVIYSNFGLICSIPFIFIYVLRQFPKGYK